MPAAIIAMPTAIRPPPAVQWTKVTSGNVSGKGRSRASPKAGEIGEWQPRDDPRHRCFASPLASRCHVCSFYLPGNAAKVGVGPR